LGQIEGKTFVLEMRHAEGRVDRLPALAGARPAEPPPSSSPGASNRSRQCARRPTGFPSWWSDRV